VKTRARDRGGLADDPVWSAALPARRRPPPAGTVRADVAIVGGGFAGLSAALHLCDRAPGARVLVLEAGGVGAGASGRTTGMLGPGVGQSLAALVGRLGRARAAALYRATLGAVTDARSLIAREGIDCDLVMGGQLVRARTRACRARLAAQARLMRELALPVEVLDDDACARAIRLPPAPGAGDDGPAALRLPVAGTLHPGKLLAGLAAAAERRGVVIHEDARVAALDTTAWRGWPVRLELANGARVIAHDVVVAAAGYAPSLGLLRGRVLPVHLQALATAPLAPAAVAELGWERGEGVVEARRVFNYFRLTADGRIVFGGGTPRYRWGGRLDGGDGGGAGVAARADLEAELGRTFPAALGLRVERAWSGVIGYTTDTLPAIGRLRGRPGVVHVGGWSGHGVALSLASGPWVAALVHDRADGADLPWFRERPPLVPFEPLRWTAFRATVAAMRALDRAA
jgi:glycine/D-amino acid oxidase-like deaminating enzyme